MNEHIFRYTHRMKPSQRHKDGWVYMNRWFGPSPVSDSSRVRVWPFVVMVVAMGMFLFGRLTQLTIVEGSYRRELADENRVIAIRRAAARGIIFDADNQPLVRNLPVYKRQVPGTTVAQSQFESITHEEAVKLSHVPGERVFFDIDREYLCGEACAVIMGYIGEINQDEWDERREDYVMGDMIGKAGIEKVYEMELRGAPGSELVEVNASGGLVREVGREYARPGIDLHTSINVGLQQLLYDALAGRKGAAVAQNPHTGAVLAMVSSPSYDPNNVVAYLDAEDMPFFNRVIGGTYPPGSIYKVVTAVAGLEEGVITGDTLYEDTGEIRINEYSFGNWYYHEYGRTEGAVDVIKALQRSNDIFFYKLGGDLGVERLAEWSRLFGFEDNTSMAEWGAARGTIPDPQWKEKTKGERWFLGNTYHMSIGQGDVLVTPMQLNRMFSVIAAGGYMCNPHILERDIGKQSCVQMNLSQTTVDLVREGLKRACEPGGTGAPFFNDELRVACKTGTAQQGSENHEPHAWFSVYAPVNDPEIVLTVLVEDSGQGSEVAAPVAKEAIEYWFDGDRELNLKRLGLVEEGGE